MAHSISNSDNIIDSRDIIARIEELEGERDSFVEDDINGDIRTIEDWGINYPSDAEELKALQELAEEAEGYTPDWKYGATLINEDYFTEYCEQLVVDIGDLPHDIPSYLVIDWEATAENIKQDYSAVDFDGTTFYIR